LRARTLELLDCQYSFSIKVVTRQAKDHADYTLCQDAMSMTERNELNAIHTNTTIANSNIEHDAWEMNIDDVLSGTETIDISHAGGEFSFIMHIADDLLSTVNR
jgi:hypothetical protein